MRVARAQFTVMIRSMLHVMALFSCIGYGTAAICSIAEHGAKPDNQTDNSAVFRAVTSSDACNEVVVPPGIWMTGPFNLTSNTVLTIMPGAVLSGSREPRHYPIVTQLPVDEAYRAPWMKNRQYQALISAYSATNITIRGGGVVDGNGWDWWKNVSKSVNASNTYYHQRPKLVELIDSKDIVVANITLRDSPFWTLHPIFCTNVRVHNLTVLAPRDHGNTDGVDPDSCRNVHVTDTYIDVGDDAVSVKSGLHWKTKAKVPAKDYLFERVTILYRNFAIGSDVSGDVLNITFRDSIIGDEKGSSPWAIKIKTDSQEGGVVDGVYFQNITIGNITYCGSSKFVFTPPHSEKNMCEPKQVGATMIDVGMGYGLKPTNPGVVRNVVFDGLHGIGPTGASMAAHGLSSVKDLIDSKHIHNLTIKNVDLKQGAIWSCNDVDNVTMENVSPLDSGKSSCAHV